MQRERQAAGGEDLVRAKRRVVRAAHVIDVDDVVEAAVVARETRAEARRARARERGAAPGRSTLRHIASALIHSAWISTGLPMRGVITRSPTLRVHPGELHAGHARGKQTVRGLRESRSACRAA